MKPRRKPPLALLLSLGGAALIMAACMMFPWAAAQMYDRQQTGTLHTESYALESMPVWTQYSLLQKLRFFAEAPETVLLSQEYTVSEKLERHLQKEISLLLQKGLPLPDLCLPDNWEAQGMAIDAGQYLLLSSNTSSPQSLVIWQCNIKTQNMEKFVECYIDDETGKILAFAVLAPSLLPLDSYTDPVGFLQQVGQAFGEYLGVSLQTEGISYNASPLSPWLFWETGTLRSNLYTSSFLTLTLLAEQNGENAPLGAFLSMGEGYGISPILTDYFYAGTGATAEAN